MSAWIPCNSCNCVVKIGDERCPSCGAPLGRAEPSGPRMAVLALLGLSALSACGGGNNEINAAPAYGIAETPPPPSATAPAPEPSQQQKPPPDVAPLYGVPATPNR